MDKNLFIIFWNCPKKVPRGTPSTFSMPSQCFWRGWSRRDHYKKDIKSKKSKKKKKKIWQFFFFLIFRYCPKKDAQGDAVYILSALIVFLKRIKQRRLLKVHPPNVRRGTLILFNLIDCGRLSFQVSRFLNTGIERQHKYLSYKLLNTSVALFLHNLWRDSHSWLRTPRRLQQQVNPIRTKYTSITSMGIFKFPNRRLWNCYNSFSFSSIFFHLFQRSESKISLPFINQSS